MKGRDFYDFVWYASRNVPVNLPHLKARILQSGNAQPEKLTLISLKDLLKNRFECVDISAATKEVRPFLRDARELDLWSQALFLELADKISEPMPRT